jgi:peptidoglycan/xylan/chitin deacetylase (PgdA/CDA1 family)
MERNRGKIKTVFIIINLLIILGLSYFAYTEYQKNDNKNKELVKINEKYKTLLNDDTIGKEEIEEINEKINDLENINNGIKEKQQSVFKLASELEHKIKNKETDKKIAYLTFDDGPYYNTYNVLRILKEKRVKATFFTTNVNGDRCYDNKSYECHKLYSAIAKDNHTIANHTYTHGWNAGLYNSAKTLIDAVKKQEELVKKETGLTTNIMRFPGGSGTPKLQGGNARFNSMVEELRKNGYGWVDWTAQDGDGGWIPNAEAGWKNFLGSIGESIEVVLFHDYDSKTTAILPKVIDYLQENNYVVLPLFYDSVMINK